MHRLSAQASSNGTLFRFDGGTAIDISRTLPVETPVNLVYAAIPYAVMMATPSDLEDFAYGFSLTEGVIDRVTDIRSVVVEEVDTGLRLVVSLAPEKLHGQLARGRNLAGRTGCGVCGIDDLAALPKARTPSGEALRITLSAVRHALRALESRQPLNHLTHAVHAAAWCTLDGVLVAVREDVGRHNALDKLIGALLQAGIDPRAGFCVITSRCSFEMVEKLATFGGRTLVAISAPTSLAVERARINDVALLTVARADSAYCPTGAERFVADTELREKAS